MSTGPHWAKQPGPGAQGPLGACCFILSSKEPLVLESLLGREKGRRSGATLPADSAADLSHPLPAPHRGSKMLVLKITQRRLRACPLCFPFTIGKGQTVLLTQVEACALASLPQTVFLA